MRFVENFYPRRVDLPDNRSVYKTERTMSYFHVLLSAVLVLTILSGAAATLVAVKGDTRNSDAQRKLVERLSHIALLGAVTIITILSRVLNG
ncbi:hypothetical protein A33O_19946 [Nitratireductor aquibiodomus RA22]|uniref:HIG1 domain-containing protein n=1 Tax=Nitratireductor aquibiodomus RA22 TaxID=1189611 RepID=I5BS69_9HYPH|nr:hypothetical protein A33O_19946 [Nitratireductor aquibiodomus RA22]